MKALTITLKQKLTLILLSSLLMAFNPVMAESNIQIKQNLQNKSQKHGSHSKDTALPDESKKQFHGVFYGYIPCEDCNGTQATLSLKNKNNYLLVTQPAKASSREYFDKGKYIWDDETNTVTLTSRKSSKIQRYHIEDEKTLFMLDAKGTPIKGKKNKYALRKRDMKKSNKTMHH